MSAPAREHAVGTLLVLASAIAFSTAGFFTRLVPLDLWSILLWRGLFGGAFIAAFMLWRDGRGVVAQLRAMRGPALAVTGFSTLGMVLFVAALRRTSVADVGIIYAASPFLTAALGWLWLRQVEPRRTLLASAAALIGVAVMLRGAWQAGDLLGDLMALGMAISLALMMLVLRRHRDTPMLPAACLSALLGSLIAWPLAGTLHPDGLTLLYLALFGISQFGLGLLLLTLGSQLVSATEAALIGALDAPLAPLWVWLAFAEQPPVASLLGGGIVMAAVAFNLLAGHPAMRSATS